MRKRFLLLVTILTICLSLGLVLASCGVDDTTAGNDGESVIHDMVRNVKMPTSDSEGMLEWLNENGEWVALALPKLTDGAYTVLEQKPATCQSSGYMVFEIKGKEKDGAWRVTLPKLAHKWGEVQYDKDNHWRECTVCKEKLISPHSGEWIIDEPATAEKAGKKHYECSCGYKGEPVEIPMVHEHQYNKKFDKDYHWMECACGSIIEKKAHEFIKDTENPLEDKWIIDVKATCTTKGKMHKECACGYKVEKEIPLAKHQYDKKALDEDGNEIFDADGKNVMVPNWVSDSKYHWKECTVCGKVDPSFKKTKHDFNALSHRCNICGELDPGYRYENGFIIEKTKDGLNDKVVGFEDKKATVLNIPDGVKIISGKSFNNLTNITKVVIPHSVVNIEGGAFKGCTALTDILIPLDVAKIGGNIFEGCTALQNINVEPVEKAVKNYADWLPNWNSEKAVTYAYGSKSNADYTYLLRGETVILLDYIGSNTDVVVPATITDTDIVYNVVYFGAIFRGNKDITSVTIDASVKFIQNLAFANCAKLKNVIINQPAARVGANILTGCPILESITLPYIGECAIAPENGRISYYFGSNIPASFKSVTVLGLGSTIIPANAFRGSNITSITLNEGVTAIGEHAFDGCKNITEITMPKSMTAVGVDAFANMTKLKKVIIKDMDAWLGIDFASETANPIGIAHKAYLESDTVNPITGIVVNDTITDIKDYALVGADTIENITLPATLKSIGVAPFKGLKALKTIDIPTGITAIGDYAFNGCSAMTSVVIPDTVTAIGDSAFNGCQSLTAITLPSALETIGVGAFHDATKLDTIEIPASVKAIGANAFAGTNITSVKINNEALTSIGSGAFSGCAKLAKLTITNIGQWFNISFGSDTANPLYYAHVLFLNDTEVTEISVPSGVTAINAYALIGASNITKVTLPATVTKIGTFAFSEMASLTTINIPEGVTTLEMATFKDSGMLNNVVLPESVTIIDGDVFNGCIGLTDITLSSKLTIIGDGAFAMSGVKNIIIPDTVTTIMDYAFKGCNALESITFGDASMLSSIGNQAFADCTALKSILIPVSCDNIALYAFGNTPNLTIYAKVASKPANWVDNWNPQSRPVYWYSQEEPTPEMKASGNKYWHNGASGIEIWP